jgi:hypothetical protein
MFKLPEICFQLCALLLVLGACAASSKKGGKNDADTAWRPPGEPPQVFDFTKNCGIALEDEETKIVYKQSLKSQNIVTEGDLIRIRYRVEAIASLDIEFTKFTSKTDIDVKINKATDLSTNAAPIQELIIRIGALITSNAKAGITEAATVPNGEWLQLTNGSNPEWKGLLCVATANRTNRLSGKAGNHLITFYPGLANSVNPLASAEQYKKELGSGRVLNVTAKIDADPRPYRGTVTFKPVNPSATFIDPITNEQRVIQAESAWEITTQFEKGNSKIENLTNETTYYVSHTKKQFEAIVVKNTALEKPEPPTILLPAN